MTVLLYHHEVFARHDAGAWHPERPDRLVAVTAGVHDSGVTVVEKEPEPAPLEAIHRIHKPEYVAGIQELCAAGGGSLDADTAVSADSWEAALRAAGAGLDAVEALRRGEGEAAFLAVRPPGHHALAARAMGFCVFNNIAVATAAITATGERVAIVDWDVHHGNGTQETFYESGDVVYLSMHEFPFYPGTGWIEEDGDQAGAGHMVNIPFPAGTGGDAYATATDEVILPVLRSFDPHWILVSCGFDAHASDPLADLMLTEGDYARMAAALAGVAPPGRTIFFLEGGYDLDAIRGSAAAAIRATSGLPVEPYQPIPSPERAHRVVEMVAARAAQSWDLL
jgi:acetoin utilization deacetylase AcuC-like enzyme